jgi:hypothetical protein
MAHIRLHRETTTLVVAAFLSLTSLARATLNADPASAGLQTVGRAASGPALARGGSSLRNELLSHRNENCPNNRDKRHLAKPAPRK